MRISRVEVARREALAVEFFKQFPEATVASFNASLTKVVHPSSTPEVPVVEKMMNTKTAYKLREQARAAIGWVGVVPVVAEPAPVVAEVVNG